MTHAYLGFSQVFVSINNIYLALKNSARLTTLIKNE